MTGGKRTNPGALIVPAACAIFYVAAQGYQQIVFHLMADDGSLPSEIVARSTSLDQIRALLILMSISTAVVVFTAVAMRLFPRSPTSAVLGLLFSLFWVVSEVLYRSVDLFVVSRLWAVKYLAEESNSIRTALITRIQVWNEFVGGWYFGLLLALLAASICFALAAWNRQSRTDRLLSFAFQLYALAILLRIAVQFGNVQWLADIGGALYFPSVLVLFGYTSYWLLRHRSR
jgi:hypothetical protein